MAELTIEQVDFLLYLEVLPSQALDGTDMRAGDVKQLLHDLGLPVAYGVKPCGAYGHTLRWRSGHCAQCNPANIAYWRRHREWGQLYVAWSESSDLYKIGSAKHASDRVKGLRSDRYAGESDWEILLAVTCERAGWAEFMVHRILWPEQVKGLDYFKDGAYRDCREAFSVDREMAFTLVKRAADWADDPSNK